MPNYLTFLQRATFLILIVLTTTIGYAQTRYTQKVFSDIKVKTYSYADTLKLDFYSYKKDTVTNKPLLILVHGGGFSGGKRNNPLEIKFCEDMAKRGYAVASMSYRLVRKGNSLGFGCNCPADQKIETFVSVSRDIIKATQFLIDKKGKLKFNPESIILVGSSAGAEAVLNTVFMKNEYTFKKLPYATIKYAGVISFAGAIVNANYITKNTAIPTMLFHGAKDNMVPYATAPHHLCEENKPGFIMLDGSYTIAEKLEKLDVAHTLVSDKDGNHNWANIPYSYTNLIAKFITESVLEKQNIQSTIKVKHKN
ncbi:secreted lipase/esterase [Cellulophaga lytica DSM 7489]|uniref:Secreted lipase/esterase n=1 Tax=Cellulophaga lytica (strain ATCC 23178 / DSM 7489 / JCM 8516 / NBRC 14961 / NCIMB 1423 / VKM B-1433 / Cy l20) TaxID=867900 RepID=F0RGT2_CELLC|nr:carboxylesterase family protein [Cellulophaga lytica]ADY29111.1 secreted lipase/esterase [Cellulophaga lytica DSM 7489]WQG76717.1 carboxylesterase family protein [Cellulophaga lytica]